MMKTTRVHRLPGARSFCHRQAGFTLIELLVSLVISLIAVSGMLIIMSTTVGTTAEVIETTRTSNELRTALELVSREVRRANFDEDFIQCIGVGDSACNLVSNQLGFVATPGDECMSYGYRRYDYATGGWPVDDTLLERGAVRVNADEGTLEFNDGGTCAAGDGWLQITDPSVVRVTGFSITDREGDNLLSHDQEVSANLSQAVRKYRVRLTGYSCSVGPVETCAAANQNERAVETTIRVRNDLIENT
jgi:prepilin-type N-terminal cleavage/methylation domain-containing protein